MAGTTRRDLLVLGGAVGIVVGLQRVLRSPPEIVYSRIEGAPGWRFGTAGQVSGLSGTDFMTLGLDAGPAPLPAAQLPKVLYPKSAPGEVPVAVFSDFFCPYCRTLLSQLKGRSGTPVLSVNWHELPLLGPNSVLAGKAAIAADLQGAYVPFYEALVQNGYRPSARWMAEVAGGIGLDAARLRRDMEGAEVAARLSKSAAAAATLGIYATPGLAVNRDVVLGALRADQLDALFSAG